MKGRCPFAVWRGDDGMGGYPAGTPDQNRPLIFVDHIMAGYKSTLDGQWRINAGVDVTFGIGRDGSLSQYTNTFDAHWGNGVAGARANDPTDRRGVDRYDRSNRHLKALEDAGTWVYSPRGYWWLARKSEPGVSALNAGSIATEQEGFPFDRPGFDATWPEAMIQMNIRTKRWTMEEFARYGYQMPPVDDDLLVGHYQIDGVNRPNCPGPEWPKARILSALKPDISTPSKGDDMRLIKIKGQSEVYAVGPTGLTHMLDALQIENLTGRRDWNKLLEEIDLDDPDINARRRNRALVLGPTTFVGGIPKAVGGLRDT